MSPTHRIITGDALATLKDMPAGSVHCCVTSPPYFNLRDYGTATWSGGDPECDHIDDGRPIAFGPKNTLGPTGHLPMTNAAGVGRKQRYRDVCDKCGAVRDDQQLGAEPTVDLYVAHLVEVFREVRRVLHPRGLAFVVIGDSYAGSSQTGGAGKETITGGKTNQQVTMFDASRRVPPGTKPKDLLLVPFALAFALRADGWILRSVVPWVKWQSCMPESARDRPTSAVEYVLMLAKGKDAYWDGLAIARASTTEDHHARYHSKAAGNRYRNKGEATFLVGGGGHTRLLNRNEPSPNGRQYRNADAFLDSLDSSIASLRSLLAALEAVRANGGPLTDEDGDLLALLVNPQPFTARSLGILDSDHYAAFPPKLVEPLIKAACPERVCPNPGCRAPWERVVERGAPVLSGHPRGNNRGSRNNLDRKDRTADVFYVREKIGDSFCPTCSCPTNTLETAQPGTVLDCFLGTGTTLHVAKKLGRHGIGIELSEAYVRIAERRLAQLALDLTALPADSTADSTPIDGHRTMALWEEDACTTR